jgi:1-deoxy-D-xylulose-5-phosphate reductoisomerase
VVLNAANEVAVAAFLDRRIGFNAIAELIEEALNASRAGDLGSIEACVGVDADTRRFVQRAIETRQGARSS